MANGRPSRGAVLLRAGVCGAFWLMIATIVWAIVLLTAMYLLGCDPGDERVVSRDFQD
jgi:hypothetical protein